MVAVLRKLLRKISGAPNGEAAPIRFTESGPALPQRGTSDFQTLLHQLARERARARFLSLAFLVLVVIGFGSQVFERLSLRKSDEKPAAKYVKTGSTTVNGTSIEYVEKLEQGVGQANHAPAGASK